MATAEASEIRETKHFIGGEWTDPIGGATFEDRNPFTGDVVAHVAAGDGDDAERAIDAAAEAFAGLVADAAGAAPADLPEGRRHPREPRRTRSWAGSRARPAAPSASRCSSATSSPASSARRRRSRTRRSGRSSPPTPARSRWASGAPSGVVGAIAPWNAALILSARAISAPLALGNTVVLKPSEHSPYVGGLLWGEIFTEAGLPAGVLNVVTHARGEAAPIGKRLVEDPRVPVINFTGSTETGRRLAEAAGRNLKRVLLELGGHNPLIVLADADLEFAVNASAFGAFLHQGQICMSARRIIVERSIAEEFTRRLAEKTAGLKAGDPGEPDTIIGPLITEDAVKLVQSRVDDAVAQGAKVLAGGEADGSVYRATLLTDVPARLGPRAARDVRPRRGDRRRRQPRRGGRSRERDGLRPRRPGSSRATPTAACGWRSASRRASST